MLPFLASFAGRETCHPCFGPISLKCLESTEACPSSFLSSIGTSRTSMWTTKKHCRVVSTEATSPRRVSENDSGGGQVMRFKACVPHNRSERQISHQWCSIHTGSFRTPKCTHFPLLMLFCWKAALPGPGPASGATGSPSSRRAAATQTCASDFTLFLIRTTSQCRTSRSFLNLIRL